MAEPVWEGRLPFAGGAAFLLAGLHLLFSGHLWNMWWLLAPSLYSCNLWLYYLLFPSPTLSSHTHTHTHTRFSLSFVKDKGALPRVPPPTLSHVMSVLTHSNIRSIKTSSHTVLISYWQHEVNVPILLCFNWLDENFQTLLMSYNLISIRASLHQSNALLELNSIFQANK